MALTWTEVAEGWHLSLEEFLGKRTTASLPEFDPFERITAQYQWHSLDAFSSVTLGDFDGFKAVRIKSRVVHERDTVVLVKDGHRVGFIARHKEGCDTVTLHPSVRRQGLVAPFILAAMRLRAQGRFASIEDVKAASRELFNGGSYTCAGLAAVKAAHRLAVSRAVAGKKCPA